MDKFAAIRPYNNDEIKQAVDQLLADRQFQHLLKSFVPWLPKALRHGAIRLAFTGVHSTLGFQLRFMKPLVHHVMKKCSDGVTFGHDAIQKGTPRYTFISNHRDIVLDSAFLDVLLHEAGFDTTCEIAIGDNLLIYPWIRILVRLNKAFTVRRGLSPRELMASSLLMSEYMHHVVNVKHENIWIAQREGRAKDSNDRTQESVLKMLTIASEDSPLQALKDMHIVPLSISYEYDPCDYLKAMEMQQKRDNPAHKKSRQDDLDNMKTGIWGYKGRVHYQATPCIDPWLDTLKDVPKTELFKHVAQHMDTAIHRAYRLYPGNYVAADMLQGSQTFSSHYTQQEKDRFLQYLDGQIAKITIPNPDIPFLKEKILTMYANPLFNQLAAQ